MVWSRIAGLVFTFPAVIRSALHVLLRWVVQFLRMKTNFGIRLARGGMICVLVLKISPAPAQVTTNSFLSLAQTNGGRMSLTISNSGDQVWSIQSSSNLASWATVEKLKVFNGAYHRSYTIPTGGKLFYRAFFSGTNQNIFYCN